MCTPSIARRDKLDGGDAEVLAGSRTWQGGSGAVFFNRLQGTPYPPDLWLLPRVMAFCNGIVGAATKSLLTSNISNEFSFQGLRSYSEVNGSV